MIVAQMTEIMIDLLENGVAMAMPLLRMLNGDATAKDVEGK